jgi:hypothetical protein
MAISTNYTQSVQVNGFTCRNCTDVDNARKHIDPAHPRSGPYGVDAATDPTKPKGLSKSGKDTAGTPTTSPQTTAQATGRLIDIQA